MANLELKATRGWSLEQAARVFHLTVATAGIEQEGITRADPGLVRDGGVFRLQGPASPAVNAASVNFRDVEAVVPGTDTDVDGQPRHDLPDVGCDEWSTEPVRHRPLCPEDVGPEWMNDDPPR